MTWVRLLQRVPLFDGFEGTPQGQLHHVERDRLARERDIALCMGC